MSTGGGVAGLPEMILAAGGALAIVIEGPTDFHRRAAVRCDGVVVEELAALGLPAASGPASAIGPTSAPGS